jgi:hypothetical protein
MMHTHAHDAMLFTLAADAAATMRLQLTGHPVAIAKAKPRAPLTKNGFLGFVAALAVELQQIAKSAEEKARVQAMKEIPKRWDTLTDAQREEVYRRFGAALGSIAQSINPKIADELRKRSGEMVASTREVMIGRYRLPIAARMSQIDQRIIDHASSAQSNYVTDEYKTRQVNASTRARTVVEQGLRDGLDYNDIGKRLEDVLAKQLGRSSGYFASVASIHAARSRTWGQLSALDEADIERYQLEATLDEATCFAAGTPVLMADGSTKAIDAIVPGEQVISSAGIARRVVATKITTARKWYAISCDDGTRVIATKDHPFLTRGAGWVYTASLRTGDQLVRYAPTGPGAANTLWGHDETAWRCRRGKLEARTVYTDPWPRHDLAKCTLVTATIVSIEQLPVVPANAYDIQVEHDSGFVACGLIVHNSAICRLMHGKTFEVSAAMRRHLDVEGSQDPEAIKDLLPFVGHGRDKDKGEEFLYIKQGEKRIRVANVDDSGIGRIDDTGKFSKVMSDKQLASRGILVPPFHGRCRTLLIPVF